MQGMFSLQVQVYAQNHWKELSLFLFSGCVMVCQEEI